MSRNPDATVYVYRHRETGAITALYSDAALDMLYQADHEHVATLEPRAWIEHHFDDAVKEREACAKIADAELTPYPPEAPVSQYQSGIFTAAEHIAEAIRARGN